MIDVGGGDSRLVDRLLERGLTCLTVLDISPAAIDRAKTRLGHRADAVGWIEANVTSDWQAGPVDIWHDRAAFHFLIEPAHRQRYLESLRRTLKPLGHAVIATFAADGPLTCSGMPVVRYSPDGLSAALGQDFSLVHAEAQDHVTPGGAVQRFAFAVFQLTPVR